MIGVVEFRIFKALVNYISAAGINASFVRKSFIDWKVLVELLFNEQLIFRN